MIYFDHNASTPVREEVAAAMADAIRHYPGNPSSPHREGRRARQALNQARARIARILGVDREEIVFTSGATEANNLALMGVLLGRPPDGRHALASAIEHPSVLEPLTGGTLPGVETTIVGATPTGRVDPDEVLASLSPRTALIALQLANNEIGTLQPVSEIVARLRDPGSPGPSPVLVCDAVQAVGRIPLDIKALGADIVTISGHKIGGPRGTGILYRRREVTLVPVLRGGHQEGGARPGTENVPAAIGMALALEAALAEQADLADHTAVLRERLAASLRKRFPNSVIHSPWRCSLPNTLSVAFPGCDARSLVAYLDLHGIAVSTGSACASGARTPSHVIRAIGQDRLTRSTLRFSFGKANQAKEIDHLLDVLTTAPGIEP